MGLFDKLSRSLVGARKKALVLTDKQFAQELLGGRAQGYGNFAVRNRDTGYYSWASVSYRVLFDDVGRAVRAVGVLEDMPQSRDGWSPAQRQLPEGLVADLIVRMCANLDLDTVESLWIEGSNVSGQVQETRCSQILLLEKEKLFGKKPPPKSSTKGNMPITPTPAESYK